MRLTSGERRDWLIARLKERFPRVTDEQLARVYLTWRETTLASFRSQGLTTRVYVIVGIAGYSGATDDELLSYSAGEITTALSAEGGPRGMEGDAPRVP